MCVMSSHTDMLSATAFAPVKADINGNIKVMVLVYFCPVTIFSAEIECQIPSRPSEICHLARNGGD